MGLYPKHVSPSTLLRGRLRVDRLTFVETPDMYRGTVAGGNATNGDVGAWAVGEELGVAVGADAFKGTIGQSLSSTSPMYIKYPQSLVFYATDLSTDGTLVAYAFTISGYDWWGRPVSEAMVLQTIGGAAATQAKETQFVYSRIHSIKLNSITNVAKRKTTGFIAIGHGKSLVNTSILFRPRIIVSPMLCRAEIQGVAATSAPCGLGGLAGIAKILDPNGLPIALTTNTGANQQWDAAKGGVQLEDGTALVAGEYTVHYSDNWMELI